MNVKELILIGGGGHCKSVIDVIKYSGEYHITGILDQPEMVGASVLNYPVIGTDADIPELIKKECWFLVTVGQIERPDVRSNLFDHLQLAGAKLATVIAPSAHISAHAIIGAGSVVLQHVVANASAQIGNNTIINTGAIIEHDVMVGNHCHISTQAVINGGCTIGDGTFVGSNSVLLQGIKIGEQVVIGAGSVVTKPINEPGVYIGNPAKKMNKY